MLKSFEMNQLRWQTNVCPKHGDPLAESDDDDQKMRMFPIRVFVLRSA